MSSLRNEWKLLWASLTANNQELEVVENDPFVTGKLEAITFDQLKEISRTLSGERKKLNQKLEKLSKEIDLNAAKLESLRLVGSSDEATLKRIVELTDLGQGLVEALHRIDNKLRSARNKEEEILKSQDLE